MGTDAWSDPPVEVMDAAASGAVPNDTLASDPEARQATVAPDGAKPGEAFEVKIVTVAGTTESDDSDVVVATLGRRNSQCGQHWCLEEFAAVGQLHRWSRGVLRVGADITVQRVFHW